jgi:hypothetical protein
MILVVILMQAWACALFVNGEYISAFFVTGSNVFAALVLIYLEIRKGNRK